MMRVEHFSWRLIGTSAALNWMRSMRISPSSRASLMSLIELMTLALHHLLAAVNRDTCQRLGNVAPAGLGFAAQQGVLTQIEDL